MDSIREQVIKQLLLKLQTITIANGYHFDYGDNANRSILRYDEEEVPAITLWSGSESTEEAYGYLTRTMNCEIDVFVLQQWNVIDDVIVNQIIADIQLCISINTPSFNDLITNILELNSDPILPENGSKLIAAKLSYSINYQTKNNPYKQ